MSQETDREALLSRIRETLSSVIRGKDAAIDQLLVGVLSGGHVLIEDVPGVGKTTLAKALARVFAVEFSRVQFTPDLLPSDVLGASVLNPREGTFAFHPGPIFTNVLLADEINRASPRTQSALLEAMNEDQVTIDGAGRPLPRPFFVIATQNPVDFQGTYPLPEAQLDRFALRLSLGYPNEDAELSMLTDRRSADPLTRVEAIADSEQLLALQDAVREVEVRETVSRYILQLVARTRDHRDFALGISPRGSLALYRASQAHALLAGRTYTTPDDVQAVTPLVLSHRAILTQKAQFGGERADSIISSIVESVAVPT